MTTLCAGFKKPFIWRKNGKQVASQITPKSSNQICCLEPRTGSSKRNISCHDSVLHYLRFVEFSYVTNVLYFSIIQNGGAIFVLFVGLIFITVVCDAYGVAILCRVSRVIFWENMVAKSASICVNKKKVFWRCCFLFFWMTWIVYHKLLRLHK